MTGARDGSRYAAGIPASTCASSGRSTRSRHSTRTGPGIGPSSASQRRTVRSSTPTSAAKPRAEWPEAVIAVRRSWGSVTAWGDTAANMRGGYDTG